MASHRLATPRAAALAGVIFAVLFGTALTLIDTALPAGAQSGSQWISGAGTSLRVATVLMPFAGIAFLWFIGVLRDGFGRYEDRFFATVFFGSGLLFLAMMFASFSVGVALVESRTAIIDSPAQAGVAAFGQMLLVSLSKTYGLRMGAVFMVSLATIWLRTGVMPRWLVWVTYFAALVLLFASDVSIWMTLVFPVWVLIVSLLLLVRAGVVSAGV